VRLRQSSTSTLGRGRRVATVAVAGIAVTIVSVRPTQDAVAQGATRSLTIYHAHTKEQETVTFKQFGSYSSAGLQKLNWLLRDWRQDEPTRMDPALFDILWEVQRAAGSSGAIHVVSAYRSPGTNAMLARRSRGVAKNSQHMSGRALDFSIPDVSISTVRDIGLRLQAGGVGYYPNANNPWVHLDTGGVRHWPKVSREHLVRLFPDEKTVHIPRDGKPLAGFEAARAIIEARGGSVSSGYIDIAEGRATGKTLFQILFGGGDEEEDSVVGQRGKRGRTAVASRQSRGNQVAALSPEAINEGSAVAFFSQNNATTSVAAATPAAQASIRSRPSRPTPLPEPQEAPAAQAPRQEPPRPEPARQEPPKQEAPRPIEVAALQQRPETAVPFSTRSDADEARRVNVPLPQRRPSTLVIGPTLVNIPLPQSRPSILVAAASPAPSDPIAQVLAAPAAPARAAEPERIVQAAARPTAPAMPQPRPGDLPSAIAAGLRTNSSEGPTAALAYAPQAQPQRITPAQPATQQAAAAPPAVDRKAMNSLMAQIAATANPDRGGRVAPTSVAAVTGIKTLTGRFETLQTQPKVETAGFSGSAIRPLAPQGFRRVE
jgi:uncharacterized protein YcbK (DUF882 family)